ncbi:hypothetical protein K435DRAFT_973585 [Dendrothele bispora CBS 962.96]|uniref:GH16 domain-containing protein n=1 Tax=Dendrothele bispora (strain CBS 962.96) TaxID=1314807 RepID=A0A4S8KRK7_DENBC|nr:hypothetical protein K435DRAFT_973585 [Dendrothele bispora CBS 962.96]
MGWPLLTTLANATAFAVTNSRVPSASALNLHHGGGSYSGWSAPYSTGTPMGSSVPLPLSRPGTSGISSGAAFNNKQRVLRFRSSLQSNLSKRLYYRSCHEKALSSPRSLHLQHHCAASSTNLKPLPLSGSSRPPRILLVKSLTTSNQTVGSIINPVQSARTSQPETGYDPLYGYLPVNNTYGGWPASGEIDMVESRGNDIHYTVTQLMDRIYVQGSLHWGPSSSSSSSSGYSPSSGSWFIDAVSLSYSWWSRTRGSSSTRSFAADFHEYVLEWTERVLLGSMWTLGLPYVVGISVLTMRPVLE